MSVRAPERRRAEIESLMSVRTEVDIPSLAAHFAVSEMTIRRDLEALESEGVVRRLIGGRAVMVDPKNREPALAARPAPPPPPPPPPPTTRRLTSAGPSPT